MSEEWVDVQSPQDRLTQTGIVAKTRATPFMLLDRARDAATREAAHAITSPLSLLQRGTQPVTPFGIGTRAAVALTPTKALEPAGAVVGGTAAQVLFPGVPLSASLGAGLGAGAGHYEASRRRGAPDLEGSVGVGATTAARTYIGSKLLEGGGALASQVGKIPAVSRGLEALGETSAGQALKAGAQKVGEGLRHVFPEDAAIVPVKPPYRQGLMTSEEGLSRMAPKQRDEYLGIQAQRIAKRQARQLGQVAGEEQLANTESAAHMATKRHQLGVQEGNDITNLNLEHQALTYQAEQQGEKTVRGLQEVLIPRLKEESDRFVATAYEGVQKAGNPSYAISEFPEDVQPILTEIANGEAEIKASSLLSFLRGNRQGISKAARAGKALYTARDVARTRVASSILDRLPEEITAPYAAARDRWGDIAPIRDALVEKMGLNPKAPRVESGIKMLQSGITGASRDAQLVLEGLDRHFGIKAPADLTETLNKLSQNEAQQVMASQEWKQLRELANVEEARGKSDIAAKFLGKREAIAGTTRQAERTLEGARHRIVTASRTFPGGESRQQLKVLGKRLGYSAGAFYAISQLRQLLRQVKLIPSG